MSRYKRAQRRAYGPTNWSEMSEWLAMVPDGTKLTFPNGVVIDKSLKHSFRCPSCSWPLPHHAPSCAEEALR